MVREAAKKRFFCGPATKALPPPSNLVAIETFFFFKFKKPIFKVILVARLLTPLPLLVAVFFAASLTQG